MGHGRRRTGVSRWPAFWWGLARLPVLLRRKPCSPLPSASKMDSHSGSSAFPVIIPHALQPCLLLTELPSCGLAGGGSGGVRQSPRLPRPRASPPPPRAPSGGKAASSPGPGRSLSGVGAGSCAWPQELPGLCQALPALCTLRSLSEMLHTAVLTWSRLPGLPQPRCLSSGRSGLEWRGGPFCHDSGGGG